VANRAPLFASSASRAPAAGRSGAPGDSCRRRTCQRVNLMGNRRRNRTSIFAAPPRAATRQTTAVPGQGRQTDRAPPSGPCWDSERCIRLSQDFTRRPPGLGSRPAALLARRQWAHHGHHGNVRTRKQGQRPPAAGSGSTDQLSVKPGKHPERIRARPGVRAEVPHVQTSPRPPARSWW
jgi:hypothetical protein